MALSNLGIEAKDFDDNAGADFGDTLVVTRIPVTKEVQSMGDEVLTEGTPENFTIAIFDDNVDKFTAEKYGLHLETEAYLMTPGNVTVNKEDLIEVQGIRYRVINVDKDGPAGEVVLYTYCELHRVTQ